MRAGVMGVVGCPLYAWQAGLVGLPCSHATELQLSPAHACMRPACRAGSVEGWPRPPPPEGATQRQQAEAEQRQQARAARRTGKAAGVANKRQGRSRDK